MRKTLLLLLIFGVVFTTSLYADSIQYEVNATSTPGLYEFDYILSGLTFSQGDELDISFDPTVFACLGGDPSTPGCGDAVTNSDFSYMVNQPNNPSGAPGDFILFANVDNPSLTGTFSIDFEYAPGIGTTDAGSQPFTLYDFPADGTDGCDDPGGCVVVEASGMTVQAEDISAPEPASVSLSVMTMFVLGVFALQRRLRGSA